MMEIVKLHGNQWGSQFLQTFQNTSMFLNFAGTFKSPNEKVTKSQEEINYIQNWSLQIACGSNSHN